MSDTAGAGLKAVTFGTPDGGLWGVAVQHGASLLVAGDRSGGQSLGGDLHWSEDGDGAWRLEGGDTALTIVPDTAPVTEDGAPAPTGTGPLRVRVRGRLALGGTRDLDAVGVRAEVAAPRSAKDAPASARLVGAWLAGGAALGLIAARPRRSAHQDGDVSAAALFDPDAWIAVSEPRLSTTYDEGGVPRRMNLELWIGEGDNEYPRRAAGEASGAGAEGSTEGLTVRAVPLTCHSRDETGAGVYTLVTF